MYSDDFFCITSKIPEDVFDVMMMLSTYDPLFRTLRYYDDAIMLVVYQNGDSKEAADNFRLAEMACQMNYNQVGSIVCPICTKADASGNANITVCGHLTFGV